MEWANALAQGVMLGGLYALFATGLSLMFGVMRIINLAHGDFAIVACFIALTIGVTTDLPIWVVAVVTVPLFAVVGYVMQRALLQRSLSAGPLATILVTFGLSIVIQNVLLQIYSADTRSLDIGELRTSAYVINDQISLGYLPLVTLGLAIVVTIAIQLFLNRVSLGRMIRASSDDPEVATIVGADSRHIYAIATAIAFATVAIAGLLYGMRSSFDPAMGPSRLLYAFEAVVIGGLGSLWGTLAGGMVLGLTQMFAAQIDPAFTVLAGHVVFLAVLAFRPQGLIPARSE